MARATKRLALLATWVGLQLGAGGCFYDYAALNGPKADAGATGGAGAGSGGRAGTGGTGSGGAVASGGQTGTSTGGAGTGGAGSGGRAGTGGAGTGGAGTSGGATGQAEPVLWYKFDEESGTTAADSATITGAPRNGTLTTFGTGGAVTFSTMKMVGTHAVSFTGNQTTGGGYVTIPPLLDLAPGAVTLSAWVYPTVTRDWQRVFDFGVNNSINMFLTTSEGQDANNYVRFAITLGGNAAEERINTTVALTLNTWYHLVVVLNAGSPYTGNLYINGTQAGTNAAMTLHASDLGATTGNYIGRSTFTADWYYSGHIDDFRIYNRALSAAEVTALYAAR